MDFPRYVHGPGFQMLLVADLTGYDLAIAEGWSPTVIGERMVKGDDAHDVFTAEAKAVALSHGWTEAPTVDALVEEPVVSDPEPAANLWRHDADHRPKRRPGRPKKDA